MRRLTLAAALAAALALSACSDRESPTEPQAPAPEETFGSSCQVERFPLLTITPLVQNVFPNGRLRLEALVRLGAIKLFWDTCHPDAARRLAVRFIELMNSNVAGGKLPGATDEEVQALTLAVLNGVGVPVAAPTVTGGHIGVGIIDANAPEEQVVVTQSRCLLAAVPGVGPGEELFESKPDQDRLLVIKGLPDNTRLAGFDGNQPGPFWDVDVSLLSGATTPADKVLKKMAVVGVVLKPEIDYSDGARIGHDFLTSTGEPEFELLDEGEPRPDLLAELAACTDPGENLGFGGFGGGLPGLAQAAWGSTARYLGPIARSVLLPQPLSAAVVLVGPLTGKTRTFSPFGVVDAAEERSVTLTSSDELAIVGAPLTLTATVSPAPPTVEEPLVEFFDGETLLGFEYLDAEGVATLTIDNLSLEQHSITARYNTTTSNIVVQEMVQRYDALSSFSEALGETSTSDQDFEAIAGGTAISTIISGVLNVTSTFDNLEVRTQSSGDHVLFGFDGHTRIAGTGRYDFAFVAPFTRNAIAFNVESKNPATPPASAVVGTGAGSASFPVQNESTSELTPAFIGFIATVPIMSVGFIEGPEVSGAGNEEAAVDDFIVAEVALP